MFGRVTAFRVAAAVTSFFCAVPAYLANVGSLLSECSTFQRHRIPCVYVVLYVLMWCTSRTDTGTTIRLI